MELSLSELKNSINLIDLISQDLGDNKVARITPTSAVTKCVFHAEDTPSLRISATHYHCFGCGARGDGIDWLRKYRGMSFRDAVAMFGGKGLSSIKAKPQAKSAPTPIESDARLAIFETNCKVYDELVALGGDTQYIKKRGITGSYCGRPIATLWPAGFVPKGVGLEEGKRAGLVGVSLRGNAFWRMAGRVVLPTFNRRGGILAFTGRAVADDVQPRYICTPDTALYRKKNCLYWLGSSSPSRLYILEGLIDAASFWSSLKDDTVAVVSTQGTTSKLPFKSPCASSILFDSDLPGIRGAYSLARYMEGDCEILLITSRHKDVNELICSNRSASDILGECVKVKRCGAMELIMGDGRKYSRRLLDELTAPFVKSNVDEGYPHYNSIPFLLSAYPSKSDKLKNTIENMKSNAKEKDGVFLLRKQDILNFMSAWAELCREVRIDKL